MTKQTIAQEDELGEGFGKINDMMTDLYDGKQDVMGDDDNYVTDAEKVVIGNTSGTNTGDQDLSSKQDVMGDDDNYVTDAEKVVIGNTSGTNTGDVDLTNPVTLGPISCSGGIFNFTESAASATGYGFRLYANKYVTAMTENYDRWMWSGYHFFPATQGNCDLGLIPSHALGRREIRHIVAQDIDLSKGISILGNATSTTNALTTADDGEITLESSTSGVGWVQIGDNEEFTQFRYSTDGTVVLFNDTTNVSNTDTDGNLCVFDNGTGVTIKNRLGSEKTIKYHYDYSSV